MKGLPEILATLGALKEPAALATLVRVKGSSYRKAGARMVFKADGDQTGSISAGCLETDVKARVASVLGSGAPQLATFDLGSDLDLIWGTGMGCQGKSEVLLEPVLPGPPPPWLSLCAALLEVRQAGVLATVFGARDTTEGRVGDRFVLDTQGPGLPPPPGPFAEAWKLPSARPWPGASPPTWSCPAAGASWTSCWSPSCRPTPSGSTAPGNMPDPWRASPGSWGGSWASWTTGPPWPRPSAFRRRTASWWDIPPPASKGCPLMPAPPPWW